MSKNSTAFRSTCAYCQQTKIIDVPRHLPVAMRMFDPLNNRDQNHRDRDVGRKYICADCLLAVEAFRDVADTLDAEHKGEEKS